MTAARQDAATALAEALARIGELEARVDAFELAFAIMARPAGSRNGGLSVIDGGGRGGKGRRAHLAVAPEMTP